MAKMEVGVVELFTSKKGSQYSLEIGRVCFTKKSVRYDP